MLDPHRNSTDFQRRSTLLNEVGRRLLTRSDGENRRVAEHLEQALRRALEDADRARESESEANQEGHA